MSIPGDPTTSLLSNLKAATKMDRFSGFKVVEVAVVKKDEDVTPSLSSKMIRSFWRKKNAAGAFF